jgi:ubiquinone/menaquinone biosynthesis C-methylase UbiE
MIRVLRKHKLRRKIMNTIKNDRFTKISDDYATMWNQIYAAQNLSYADFENSIFEQVAKVADFKNLPILDLGCGDGESLAQFVDAGCTKLVGLDLNPTMIAQCEARFGDKVELVQGDVTDLSQFAPGQFPVIVTGATFHNIPVEIRPKVWAEIKRLKPTLFVIGDKISDPDPAKQAKYYDNEVAAINAVFGVKYGLAEVAAEWVSHYEYDRREQLFASEIEAALSDLYSVDIVFEMGMIKTISCQSK